MAIDARHRDALRDAAVSSVRRGRLTMSEVADLIGTDRQLVRHWCLAAGIDPRAARQRYVASEWCEALRNYRKKP